MKKPYIEPEIEIENIMSLNNFLVASPPKTSDAGDWEDENTDDNDFGEPQGPWD